MSRAVNISATEAHVAQTCDQLGARITAIEPLASGGTRVVLSSSVGRADIARFYGNKVIDGTVTRKPIRLQRYS